MRRFLLVSVAAIALGCVVAGCAAYAVAPVTGFLYSNVMAPMSATSNSEYSKTGMAECTSILGLVAQGDASIQTAMKNGGITRVHHIDYKSESILGVYAKFTVIVYGD
jgi:hypothetical protein